MAIHEDIPPPYSAVGKHGVFPHASHDERARFNFLANLNKHVAGTLGPGKGGTGIATYTIGDLLYASATTTLSRLADVWAWSNVRDRWVGPPFG